MLNAYTVRNMGSTQTQPGQKLYIKSCCWSIKRHDSGFLLYWSYNKKKYKGLMVNVILNDFFV